MGHGASRFRRLPPPRAEPQPRPPERSANGDLFDHFGVRSDPRRPRAIVDATACSVCGWLLRADEPERACQVCATPRADSTDSR